MCSSYQYAHSCARGKMRYMVAAARYTANYTQHSSYTTRYTTRNTTEMLPGAAFQVRTQKLNCIFISLLKSNKAPERYPCQHFGSVACSVACSVAWGCHATLVTFTGFLDTDSASSLLLVRQPFSEMPALLCPACVAIMIQSTCARLHAFNSKINDLTSACIWPKLPSASVRCFFAVLHPGTHKISVLWMEEILHHFQRPTLETSCS